jgi:hypothetical protein
VISNLRPGLGYTARPCLKKGGVGRREGIVFCFVFKHCWGISADVAWWPENRVLEGRLLAGLSLNSLSSTSVSWSLKQRTLKASTSNDFQSKVTYWFFLHDNEGFLLSPIVLQRKGMPQHCLKLKWQGWIIKPLEST